MPETAELTPETPALDAPMHSEPAPDQDVAEPTDVWTDSIWDSPAAPDQPDAAPDPAQTAPKADGKPPESAPVTPAAPPPTTIKIGALGYEVDISDHVAAAQAIARMDEQTRAYQAESNRLRSDNEKLRAAPAGGGDSRPLESRSTPASGAEKSIKYDLSPYMVPLRELDADLGLGEGRMEGLIGPMFEAVAKSVLAATVERLGPYLVTEEERPGLGVGREIAAERALMAEARDVVALWAEDLKPEAIAFWMQRGTEMARKEGREISREVLRSSAVKWEREALAKEAAVEATKVAAVAGNGNGGAATVRDEKGRYAAVRGGVAAAGGGGRPGASGNGMRMVERRKDAGEILAAAGM